MTAMQLRHGQFSADSLFCNYRGCAVSLGSATKKIAVDMLQKHSNDALDRIYRDFSCDSGVPSRSHSLTSRCYEPCLRYRALGTAHYIGSLTIPALYRARHARCGRCRIGKVRSRGSRRQQCTHKRPTPVRGSGSYQNGCR